MLLDVIPGLVEPLRVLVGSFVEVDDPAGGRAVRSGIEVFAVEVRKQDFCVPRVGLGPGSGFFGFQHEAHTQDDAPLKRAPGILRKPDRRAVDAPRRLQ